MLRSLGFCGGVDGKGLRPFPEQVAQLVEDFTVRDSRFTSSAYFTWPSTYALVCHRVFCAESLRLVDPGIRMETSGRHIAW